MFISSSTELSDRIKVVKVQFSFGINFLVVVHGISKGVFKEGVASDLTSQLGHRDCHLLRHVVSANAITLGVSETNVAWLQDISTQ